GVYVFALCIEFRLVLFRSVFFFQAEDGIRDKLVTGVQTCALPISSAARNYLSSNFSTISSAAIIGGPAACWAPSRKRRRHFRDEIGRASCRERVQVWGGGRFFDKQNILDRKIVESGRILDLGVGCV